MNAKDENPNVTFYSTNDEMFNKENLGEVIDELEGEHESLIGLTYYTHEFRLVNLYEYLAVDSILEEADQYLYDNVGSEDGDFNVFTEASKEAKEELGELLKNWCNKHLSNRNIYEPVGKSTEHVITAEDISS